MSHCKQSATTRFGLLFLLVTIFAFAAIASASTVYTYTGKNYETFFFSSQIEGDYNNTMHLTLSFEVANPLAPNLSNLDINEQLLGFSFNDGRNSGTDALLIPGQTASFVVSTNAAGEISEWNIQIAMLVKIDVVLFLETVSGTSGFDHALMQKCNLVFRDFRTCTWDEGMVQYRNLGTWSVLPGAGEPKFAGTPGASNCHGVSIAALVQEFGGLPAAARVLGFSSVKQLQNAIGDFCRV